MRNSSIPFLLLFLGILNSLLLLHSRLLLILTEQGFDLVEEPGEKTALDLSWLGHAEALGGDVVDGAEGKGSHSTS